jgi:hypothetical protein
MEPYHRLLVRIHVIYVKSDMLARVYLPGTETRTPRQYQGCINIRITKQPQAASFRKRVHTSPLSTSAAYDSTNPND